MRRSPDVSPRRLSDISPQLRQLKYLVVDEAIKEDFKWSRSVEDLTSIGLTSIEERILRITGYYGYQPWAASYKSKSFVYPFLLDVWQDTIHFVPPPSTLFWKQVPTPPLNMQEKALVVLWNSPCASFLHVWLRVLNFLMVCVIQMDQSTPLLLFPSQDSLWPIIPVTSLCDEIDS